MAYALVAYCYFTVAFVGYWAFGNAVQDNVLLSIKHPKWVVGMADIFVVIHVFGSYQVPCMYASLPVAQHVAQLAVYWYAQASHLLTAV